MGTRGLLGHIIRGKKRGVYNHFDSYPSGLGVKLAQFIRGLREEQVTQMRQNLEKIEWVKDSEAPSQEIQDRYAAFGFADLSVASKNTKDWYCLLRNVQGAAALPQILDGTLMHQLDQADFEDDKLFCEWTYFVDWEARVLHVSCNSEHRAMSKSVSFANVSDGWMQNFDEKVRKEAGKTEQSVLAW